MAATVSSPWGKPGAWALDAEEHEDELRQQLESPKITNTPAEAEFPSLAAAAAKQPKKKKNQAISLAEFTTFGAAKPSQAFQPSRGLTHDEIVNLPTGPRQRSAEELERTRLGGGFKSYGMSNRNGDDSSNSRWGGGGGNSRVSNRDRDSSREIAPSRADEIDDWSKAKKSPVGNGYDRRERGSFFDSQSKADESDSWVSNKPTETRRFGASNGGFEKRGSFDSLSRDRYGSSGGGAADSDSWGRKREDSNETGIGGIARPKLVLQPRSVAVSNDNGGGAKPKGSSPFGDARPREAVLAEKGQDWKQIDEKLDSSKETVKAENGNPSSKAWSFGNGRGAPWSNPAERSWKKPDVADTESHPERAERIENGDNSENGRVTEDEGTEGN
ncbi:eukaryotic translation initiation factor 4B3 [Euphorbia lathyris]|uniref:eukaryotic translation initiation factor 4B3 n=1 Tax=Euphorbia lathyris TaxID=212925 RepID=UPI003313FB88